MKNIILLLFIAFTSIVLGQRRVKTDKLILPKLKNATALGTDARGRVIKVDASNSVDISTKLDKGTYNGTASDLKNDIVKISNGVNTNINTLTNKLNNIPIYQAGNNIVIDNSNPLEPVINSTNISSGSNTTNLSYIANPYRGTIENSNGTNAVIYLADKSNAGLMRANFESQTEETATATIKSHPNNQISSIGSFGLYSPNVKVRYVKVGKLKRMTFDVNISASNIVPTDKGYWLVKIPLQNHGASSENNYLPLTCVDRLENADGSFNTVPIFSCKGYFTPTDGVITLLINLNAESSISPKFGRTFYFNFHLIYKANG